jgi:dephospho-CoA kinase
VERPRKKPIIGILGGVASGKSTVAAEFAELGCEVIDADKIVHKLLDKKNVRGKIVAAFGEAVLDAGGKIDRKRLADIVFADTDRLAALNSIIHPLVLARAEQLIERYSRQNRVRAIVLDMPLLVEAGWEKRCDRLIFVDCKTELRADRARKMGLLNENQLRIRENFQISVDSKASRADNTIDNNYGFPELTRQVNDIFSCIMDNE